MWTRPTRGRCAPCPSRPGGRLLPGDSGDTHLELVLAGGRLPRTGGARGAQALLQVMHGDELAGCAGQGSALEYRRLSPRPASSLPRGAPASSAPGGPLGSCSPSRGPDTRCPQRGREGQWPRPAVAPARTRLLDGDGEAVVVGAALGLHRHVAGGVTCRQGVRQARVGARPSRRTALASCSRAHRGRLPTHGCGGRGHRVPAVSLQCWGSVWARGRHTSWMAGLHHGSHSHCGTTE